MMKKKEIKTAILNWCVKNDIREISRISHLSSHCFVVGYAAPRCLIVANPWMDSEPQVALFDKENPFTLVRQFDKSLRANDWCITAYVCSLSGQENIAIPIPKIYKSKRH